MPSETKETFIVSCGICGSRETGIILTSEPYWDDGGWIVCKRCGNKHDIDDVLPMIERNQFNDWPKQPK